MPTKDEQLLGEIAVREGFLTRSQINNCVQIQRQAEVYKPLGALLVQEGYLHPGQLHAVLEVQADRYVQRKSLERKRDHDRIFAKLAISRELCSFQEVNECLKLQTSKQKKGIYIPLSRLMITKGNLTSGEVREILKIQYGVIFYCDRCERSFTIPQYSEKKRYNCTTCGEVLEAQFDLGEDPDDLDSEVGQKSQLDPLQPEPREVRLGPYLVRSELGRGAMGVVYKAWDERRKIELALKVLPGNLTLDLETVRRFQREAEAVSRVHHPGIVKIFDVGEHEGTHYFGMEFVPGQSLDYLIDEAQVDFETSARIVQKASGAVHEAHRHGIIHRDLKPENIIYDGETRRVVVTDFGLSRPIRAASLTASGAIVGTPCYMSPEQARGRRDEIDVRSDVYSLGATLYEMVTCQLPFEGEDVQFLIRQVIREHPIAPRRLNPNIPRDLEVMILKAMEKSPANRYQTAKDLADDLKRWRQGKKIVARPLPWPRRLLRYLRRHRGPLMMVFLIQCMLMVVGLVVLNRVDRKRFAHSLENRDQQYHQEILRERQRAQQYRDSLKTAREKSFHFEGESRRLRYQALMAEGRLFLVRGKIDSARSRFLEAVQSLPGRVDAHLELAELYGHLGDFGRARRSLEEVLAARPDSGEARVRLAKVFLEGLGEPGPALEQAREGCRLRPTDPEALSVLGIAALAAGSSRDLKRSARLFASCEVGDGRRWGGEPYRLLFLARVRTTVRVLAAGETFGDQMLSSLPFWKDIEEGIRNRKLGRLELSSRLLERACGRRGKDPSVWAMYWLALVESERGRWGVSKEILDRALGLDSRHPLLLMLRARYHLEKEKLNLARRDLEQVMTESPRYVEALELMIRVYHRLGEEEAALRSLQRLGKMVPDYQQLSNLRRLLNQE